MKKKKVTTEKRNISITKNDLQSALGEQSKDFKRYVGAINEDFQHKTQFIAEQYLDINKKLDSHTEMVGQLLLDIAEIKNNLSQKIDRREFARLEKRVILLERRTRAR